jgi:hypothetical protein
MAFGMGFGELVLILIIVVVVFGGTRLIGPGSLGQLLRGERPEPPRLLLERRRPWGRWDTAIVVAAVLLAAATVVLLARGH